MGWLKRRIIESLEPTMAEWERRWIPVDEALPDLDVPVLCCWSRQLQGMGVARLGYFAGETAWREIGGQEEVDEPIAWMPLPAPPTDSK